MFSQIAIDELTVEMNIGQSMTLRLAYILSSRLMLRTSGLSIFHFCGACLATTSVFCCGSSDIIAIFTNAGINCARSNDMLSRSS
jgi:hypothetical protein